jgi:hypothetical protein
MEKPPFISEAIDKCKVWNKIYADKYRLITICTTILNLFSSKTWCLSIYENVINLGYERNQVNQKPTRNQEVSIFLEQEPNPAQEVHFSSNQEPKPEPGSEQGMLGLHSRSLNQ